MYFPYFVIISPFFVPSLVEIGPVVLEKKRMRNVYDNDDGERTSCDQKSSLEPSAKVSLTEMRNLQCMIDKGSTVCERDIQCWKLCWKQDRSIQSFNKNEKFENWRSVCVFKG